MRCAPVLLPAILAFLSGCEAREQSSAPSPAAAPAQPATVYAESDGQGAWHILGDRTWNGRPGELLVAPLSEAPASITHWRTADVACLSLDGVRNFGAPDRLRKGARFRCGAARFEVVDCDFPEDCRNALIEALWRTGVAPDYGELPVNYFYNRCRGVQSITLSLDRPLRVGFGETLELRQGLGLLAQPNSPTCRRDPVSGLYDRHGESR
jgi:hypothetical protein